MNSSMKRRVLSMTTHNLFKPESKLNGLLGVDKKETKVRCQVALNPGLGVSANV